MDTIKTTLECPCCESMLEATIWPDAMGGADDIDVTIVRDRSGREGHEAC